MNLPRHTLTSHAPAPAFVNAHFSTLTERKGQKEGSNKGVGRKESSGRGSRGQEKDKVKEGERRESGRLDGEGKGESEDGQRSASMFACATQQGFFVARTHPLRVMVRKDFSSTHGGLSYASLIENSSLLVLVGGGRVPRFAPNKVILWDEEAVNFAPAEQAKEDSPASDGTASPLASTLFSVGREERVEGMGSQTLSQGADSMSMDDGPFPDDEQDSNTTASASMATSAHLDDPFGVPAGSCDKDAARQKMAASSMDQRPIPRVVVGKGREVAELEFGEAVKGICVGTFERPASSSPATLLVVILNRRAVVFEMGPHIYFDGVGEPLLDGQDRSAAARWGIRQRLVVDIQPNLSTGMAAMAPIQASNCVLLALPGRQTGHVHLISIALSNTARTSIRSSVAGTSTIIAAHANPISSITLSNNGKLLCTTSARGTLLRIWSTLSPSSSSTPERGVANLSCSLIGELRRGSDAAKILCVTFSPDAKLLAAGSDKGTIHFFNLQTLHHFINAPPSSSVSRSSSPTTGSPSATPSSTTSSAVPSSSGGSLSKRAHKFLPPTMQQIAHSIPPSLVPQYLRSQWSFAQFRVPLKVFSSSSTADEEGQRGPPPRSPPSSSLYGSPKMQMEEQDVGVGPGKQTSLEGGWAGMRGRIDDVRRGERGIEEGLWLAWIPTGSDQPPSTTTSSAPKRHSTSSIQTYPFEVVAITNSGCHYRIGLADPNYGPNKQDGNNSSSNDKSTSSTVLNMYKEDSGRASSGAGSNTAEAADEYDATNDGRLCWLVDYQRFGMRDDWMD